MKNLTDTSALKITKQLRQCLRFDDHNSSESELESLAREAAEKLEQMNDYVHELEAWKIEGEKIFSQHASSGLMFSLRSWWLDRPWR